MKFLNSLLLFFFVAACGGTIEMNEPFNSSEVSFVNRSGSAQITGQAFLRQRSGGVVTCAGNDVALIPAGAYAKEFITRAFGDVRGGRIPAIMAPQVQHPPEFGALQRRTTCDAEGDFEFRDVANGDYYISTILLWEVPGQIIPEGGALTELVQVRNGRNQRVLVNG